jgi:hypothetical protein
MQMYMVGIGRRKEYTMTVSYIKNQKITLEVRENQTDKIKSTYSYAERGGNLKENA